jgi:hypothetical protein
VLPEALAGEVKCLGAGAEVVLRHVFFQEGAVDFAVGGFGERFVAVAAYCFGAAG